MADNNAPWIREPSVKTIVKDNGNRTALEQWALLTLIPALVLGGLYLVIRSQMTADSWYTLFTIIGVAAALIALVRFGKWHRVELDPDKTRRPEAAVLGLNLVANAWPFVLALFWQAAIVEPLCWTMANEWPTVLVFIVCGCAIVASAFFGRRMIRELLDPLAGNSIEIGVRKLELRHEEKTAKLAAQKSRAQAEYAQQLEDELARTRADLERAKRGSRVIYANHGTARGNSNLMIDDNEMLNRFVVAAFGGERRTRDEWAKFLIADPSTETSTTGRQRYDTFRAVLEQAGLWNMKSGPIKTLEQACESLRIPLPQAKTMSAGGRAGAGSALAVPPDWESGAGGSEDDGEETE